MLKLRADGLTAKQIGDRLGISRNAAIGVLKRAKDRGVAVTCEVAPHHFVLTDEALSTHGGYDTRYKMNPPLREEADRAAMVEGIRDGSVDVIATAGGIMAPMRRQVFQSMPR